jgi:uncharacterized protein YbjT (DUF2867 family)
MTMIAVIGAAGNVGSKVIELLLADNQEVRVLEHARKLNELRSRGIDVLVGDLKKQDDLRMLFKGTDAALVLLPDNLDDPEFVANRSKMSAAVADALRAQPVTHVVALSSVGADREEGTGVTAGLYEFEHQLFGLKDVNVLALRSAFRMENLLASLPLIQGQKINGSVVNGDLTIPMIASQDVAREAAERLIHRDFEGHGVKTLLGPEDVSMREATALLGSQLGLAELAYIEFPPADVKGALLGAGISDEAASLLVEGQIGLNEGRFDPGPRTEATTTATRLEEFLRAALPR